MPAIRVNTRSKIHEEEGESMKKLLIAGLLSVLMFAGCEILQNISLDDITGTWKNFESADLNDTPINDLEIYLFKHDQDDGCGMDISWNDSANFYYGDGTLNNNVYTGTYMIGGSQDMTKYNITATISLSKDNKLSIDFVGDLPLNGLSGENGTLQVN